MSQSADPASYHAAPAAPPRFPRISHLGLITFLAAHRFLMPGVSPLSFNPVHAAAPPRPRRRKWKGWQQQQREAGRR